MPVRRSWSRWSVLATLLGVLAVLGALAAVVAANRAIDESGDADARISSAAAERLSADLSAVTSSLAGADVLAVSGGPTMEAFEAFASDVLMTVGWPALAYADVVSGDARGDWEAATGLTIKDTDGSGGFVPAPERPEYVPVRHVVPVTEQSSPLLGFDLLSDPVRGAGVREATPTNETVLVGPITLASSAQPGLFATRAVRDPDDQVVGYVSSGLALDALVEELQAIPGLDEVTVSMDGVDLIGTGTDEAAASFGLAGRMFTVDAEAEARSDWILPVAFVVATLLLSAGAVVAARRAIRERREREDARTRAANLADLAGQLALIASTGDVARHVANNAGAVLGARSTSVGRRLVTDQTKLEVVHAAPEDAEPAPFAILSLDVRLPITDCARTGDVVSVASRQEYASRYPAVTDDVESAGAHAVLCVPLSLGNDRSVGSLAFEFDRRLGEAELEELESTARLIAQMTGRAYERAFAREVIQTRVELLSNFTRTLTVARTADDVRSCVSAYLPPVLGLRSASLTADRPAPSGETDRVYPPETPDGEYLAFVHDPDRDWSRAEEMLAVTVVDLVQGAVTRARLYDHQHEVLQQIQDSLLTPPEPIPGYEIAVGYRSAIEAVGMGGDWYSVVDTPRVLFLVIGDVAGHGASAVALMAEVKTVVRHLLNRGTPIQDVLEQAHRTLKRRHAFASATIVRLDKATDELSFVNAGHPPMVHISDGTPTLLETVHRPWLGVDPVASVSPTVVGFTPGDLLVLYTDGLVEERGEPIDTSLDRLVGMLDPGESTNQLVNRLLDHRRDNRTAVTVDDDIALVAIRRTGADRVDDRSEQC